MPTFKDRVPDRLGKAMAGTIEAPTIEVARNHLYQTGYYPIAIEEESTSVSINLSDVWKRFQRVKPEEIIVFSQQLSTLYKAGLPLLSGFKGLRDQPLSQRTLRETGLQDNGVL